MLSVEEKNEQKKVAAKEALTYIEDGMVVGLGTGSTAAYFIEGLANLVRKKGWQLTCVSTSIDAEKMAKTAGLHTVPIDKVEQIDVTVDGADEFDGRLNGIKGGGAALLFEKIVALKSKQNIWIVDEEKKSVHLGTNFKLPVEVVRFGAPLLIPAFTQMGLKPAFRKQANGELFLTDSLHYIIDLDISGIYDLKSLATQLKSITGVVEHGSS
ncbi:ribose-5-phosphate isomerase RpiA [Fructobacillus broussonetiae]|uniref:ribose-5-phosphate isomerase RpiA n=1 Tax=Fructobacillus broussonetiae TaxID=2713173 RepID=UPI003083B265